MKASEEAKAIGFESLKHVADVFGVKYQCLNYYHRHDHDKFLMVLHGAWWFLNK